MKNEVKRISKAELEEKGLKIVMETKGDLDIDGILITEEQKKCWDTILTIEFGLQRKEHARLTQEGMQRKGVKSGRLPISKNSIAEIISLREEGNTIESIGKVLKTKGTPISKSAIRKYCNQLQETKEGIKNENEK